MFHIACSSNIISLRFGMHRYLIGHSYFSATDGGHIYRFDPTVVVGDEIKENNIGNWTQMDVTLENADSRLAVIAAPSHLFRRWVKERAKKK